MTRRFTTMPRPRVPRLAVLLLVGLTATAPLLAVSAKDLYTAALTRERELRAPADEPPTLAQLRAAMAEYKEIVRLYPRSGYSDNALWQAAGLAIQAFTRDRQPADREAGIGLLHMLEREYPSSSLVPRVADRLEQFRQLDEPVRIRAIRREPMADVVRVTIELDGEARYHAERLDSPPRLFFDLSGTEAPASLQNTTLAFDDGDMIREIRLGRHPGQTTRVVLDIEDVDTYSVYALYDPYRLVVDTVPTVSMQARRTTAAASLSPVARDTRPAPTDAEDALSPVDTADASDATTPAVALDELAAPTPDDDVRRRDVPAVASSESVAPEPSPADLLSPPAGWERRRLDPIPAPAPNLSDIAAASDIERAGLTPVVVSASDVTTPPMSADAGAPDAAGELAWPGVHNILYPELGTPPSLDSAGTAAAAEVPPSPAEVDVPVASLADREARTGTGTPTTNSDGDFSLGRQLGLGVARVVIDPGHGGYDPGAQTGTLTESALVLDVALRLESRLKAHTGIEAVLTRRDDAYVPLRARTELANQVGADLFLSIHANAARDPRARGVETYHLDLATDPTAQTVAARENAASEEGMHDLPQLVRSITMHNKRDESRDFAATVQRNLVGAARQMHPGVQDLGVKQAPFVVLIGANMPSVLAEISFLTNQEDAAFLATDTYRDLIADALLQSIIEYQQTLKPSTSFASEDNE